MIDKNTNQVITCKYCGGNTVVKFGFYKNKQRYFCKSCRRKFHIGNLPNMRVPAEYVINTLDMYYRHRGIKVISEDLGEEYNYYPSNSVIYYWIKKYTDLAINKFQHYHPRVSNVWMIWIADTSLLGLNNKDDIWIYDIMDMRTRFLLSSYMAPSYSLAEIEKLVLEASERAGKLPDRIVTDKYHPFLQGRHTLFNNKVMVIESDPVDGPGYEIGLRFNVTSRQDIKAKRAFRNLNILNQFIKGWSIYYNFFKPHPVLGKTPAEESQIIYNIKNWADLVRSQI